MGGRLRLDRRTKDLCHRLKRGEIALIDHADLDSTAAEWLVEIRPAAIVNAQRSITGRYPNTGPATILEAGIPLIDNVGTEVFERVREGQDVQVRGNELLDADGNPLASGTRLAPADVEAALETARANLRGELQRFTENTLRYVAAETEMAVGDIPLPTLKTSMRGRPVLIVVRGKGYKEDLAAACTFIREQKPVLIGVDGGADAIMEAGFRPHFLLGDMDSVSDATLRSGAEILVHTYRDDRVSPGMVRVQKMGLEAQALPAPGTSEDVAMLMAYQSGAELIVAVGTHFSLVEFLDKRRNGMASTFLTRLKVGSILVDAKGLGRLYRPALSPGLLMALIASGAAVMVVVALQSPAVRSWLTSAAMLIELWLRNRGLL